MWRRRREAHALIDNPHHHDHHPEPAPKNGERIERAINRLQRLWRQRHRIPTPRPHHNDEIQTEGESLQHTEQMERAINRLQRLWRHRRITQREGEHTHPEEDHRSGPDVEAIINRLQRLWRHRHRSPTTHAEGGPGGPGELLQEEDEVLERSQHFERAINQLQRMWRQRRTAAASTSDTDLDTPANVAVRRIQTQWRAMLRRRRLLASLRRRVDPNQAATLIQRSWAVARERRRFQQGVRGGRQDAAARVIQQRWRRARTPTVAKKAKISKMEFETPREMCCRVCYARPIEVALLPCGHAFTCEGCAAQLARCCMCRKLVCIRQRIFLP
jgi:hypothetical protein